jgi:hypothetical protein
MAHDEDDLLGRVPALTDDELRRIGALSSKGLMVRGPKGRLHSIGATKATALAAVEVLEGEPRELLRAEMERRGPLLRRRCFSASASSERLG